MRKREKRVKISETGKPRRRHAWAAFELALRILEPFTSSPGRLHHFSKNLAYGLWPLGHRRSCRLAPRHHRAGLILAQWSGDHCHHPARAPVRDPYHSSYPPGGTSSPARSRLGSSTPHVYPLSGTPASEAPMRLRPNLGVDRAASFGPTPCVSPKPRAQPRLIWSNWTQVTLVSDSFSCK